MKIKILIIQLFILLNSLYAKEQIVRVGYLIDSSELSAKRTEVLINIITKKIKNSSYGSNFVLINYNNVYKAIDDYLNENLTIIAIPVHNYFEEKERLREKTFKSWSINFSEKNYEQFYLIKNRQSNYDLKDIYKSNFYIKGSSISGKIWIDYLLLKEFKHNYKTIFYEDNFLEKDYQLLTRVFFDKDSMAVINKDAYEYIKELNPQILNKIDILKRSEEIFSSIMLLVSDDIHPHSYNDIKSSFDKFNTVFAGLGFNSLTKVTHHGMDNDNYLKEYEFFYKKYIKLKNEYIK